jgi:orotate phosphoribosyltransferase
VSEPTQRERLCSLLRERSLRHGDFTLSSGARSTYYIDARLTTMSGAGQLLIGDLGLGILEKAGWNPAAVGGLTLGADPVAYALAHAAARRGLPLDAFTVRKEQKAHGTGRRIEGAFTPGSNVVVVEDVITTGNSARQAIEAVEQANANVIGVFAVVDRQEGGRESLDRAGYAVQVLFTTSELLEG